MLNGPCVCCVCVLGGYERTQLVQNLCDTKQGYTQYGGLRPFGVSFLIAGWDVHHGFQLYQSDPSGNYGGWKATAIGANNQAAQSILRQVLTLTHGNPNPNPWKPQP